jgi:hypothetical protein
MMNWIDKTRNIELFGWQLVFSGSAALSELFNIAATYLPAILGAVLMATAQILKMIREQRSWAADERRKEERHDKDMEEH